MNARLVYSKPPERAYLRRPRLIVEAFDAVTLSPVYDGLRLRVEHLDTQPVVSTGGRFVWFESAAKFEKLLIDAGRLPYLPPAEIFIPPLPAPPPPPAQPVTYTLIRLELAPSTAYRFAPGITGLRGTLVENLADDPLVPVQDAQVRLQWIDDVAPGETWVDAPTISQTNSKGDFAAIVRLATNQIARADAQQRMRVRVAATRAGNTLLSTELQIPFDRIADVQQSFAWDDLQP
jgi:hypothetical protein